MKENIMNRSFPIARLLVLALLFVAAAVPAARAQTAKSEMKQPPTAVVSLYRIVPGKQLDFLKWMAEAAAINKEAGVPAEHWYSHTNGDSWDYLHVAPDLSNEQQAKVDEVAKKRGRKTGFAASLEIRTFIAWHTDTFVIGPVSAADLVSAAGK
jgi:membrane-bound lytic murein transglycosylase B